MFSALTCHKLRFVTGHGKNPEMKKKLSRFALQSGCTLLYRLCHVDLVASKPNQRART